MGVIKLQNRGGKKINKFVNLSCDGVKVNNVFNRPPASAGRPVLTVPTSGAWFAAISLIR